MPNRVVYKFEIPDREGTIEVPFGSEVRMVAIQDGRPHIWMEVPADEKERPFDGLVYKVVATGEEFPRGWTHLGSWIHDGTFVWHLYRLPKQ